ncbi:hypothetical protein [Alkalihalobacillus sp. AL-G]|uniref:hypothetical protein n=1 Tax=Alkalihalobacillus sp. AL-G TaxID=2926399 RepID=UPI00272D7952|nr:hypothetical protein [Alkalihalobacillus sp. AL-G]WLD94320.1 hypothetical protein MOJ78_05365 [Alkalihalobacillus sp. AL-G]
MEMFRSKTLSVSIDRAANEAEEFIRNPENLPLWATSFAKAVRKVNDQWIIETSDGPMNIRFVDKNEYGVLDHYVTVSPDHTILNPMRIIPIGDGCQVFFTLFKMDGMTEQQFSEDMQMVQQDLKNLKAYLEDRRP